MIDFKFFLHFKLNFKIQKTASMWFIYQQQQQQNEIINYKS